jgi:hypothetical protein
MGNVCNILVGKPDVKRPLGRDAGEAARITFR